MGRKKGIAKNVTYIAVSELLLAILKFVSRRVFALLLGKEYLGINGLFTDILSLLSLAELGIGTSVTYSLYRPVAEENRELIKSLMRLYRRFYQIVGLLVFLAGLSLAPFLNFFVKEMPKNVPDITLIYILNVVNASLSYCFAYKSALLFVHQKKYIETGIRAAVAIAASVVQMAVLFLARNYVHYLLIAIGATLVQNIAIFKETDKRYPYLREKEAEPLPGEMVQEILRNGKAMFLHRIGAVAVFSTDNLLISKFAGVATTGLYSNYTMIRGFLNVMIAALFDGITPAMGNLSVTETIEKRRRAFQILSFFSAWLFGWMSICLFWLYDPFIRIWLGAGYLLPRQAVFLIVVNFYVSTMRNPVVHMKSVLGLFWDDRCKSILEALLNLAASLFLVQRWGLLGILAGTLISTVGVPFWVEPTVLYRNGLKQKVKGYFTRYTRYLLVTVAAGSITGLFCQMTEETIEGFFLKMALCMAIPNMVYLAAYCQLPEFYYLISMTKVWGIYSKKYLKEKREE